MARSCRPCKGRGEPLGVIRATEGSGRGPWGSAHGIQCAVLPCPQRAVLHGARCTALGAWCCTAPHGAQPVLHSAAQPPVLHTSWCTSLHAAQFLALRGVAARLSLPGLSTQPGHRLLQPHAGGFLLSQQGPAPAALSGGFIGARSCCWSTPGHTRGACMWVRAQAGCNASMARMQAWVQHIPVAANRRGCVHIGRCMHECVQAWCKHAPVCACCSWALPRVYALAQARAWGAWCKHVP